MIEEIIFPEIKISTFPPDEHTAFEWLEIKTHIRICRNEKWYIFGIVSRLFDVHSKSEKEKTDFIVLFFKKIYIQSVLTIIPESLNENQIIDGETGFPLYRLDKNQESEQERLVKQFDIP